MEWIIVATGLFSLCGAVLDWDWFMNARKAKFVVKIFGRNGARYFYGLLGTGLMVLGFLMVMGIIEQTAQ